MSLAAVQDRLAAVGLALAGGFHPGPSDGTPERCRSLLLIRPDPVRFWPALCAAPEGRDGLSDPVDRWSARVIGDIARALEARALFPFEGPPFWPFFAWGLRTGAAFQSPVQFLVHQEVGLMISYRGALAFDRVIDLPVPVRASPCLSCAERPCLRACPAGAMTKDQYDVARCRDWLNSAGADCAAGCLVRRACPLSPEHATVSGQTAWAMRNFIHERAATDPDPPCQIRLG